MKRSEAPLQREPHAAPEPMSTTNTSRDTVPGHPIHLLDGAPIGVAFRRRCLREVCSSVRFASRTGPGNRGRGWDLGAPTSCTSTPGSSQSCSGSPRGPPAPPTVDELITRNIEARGGAHRLKAIQSLRTTGKMQAAETPSDGDGLGRGDPAAPGMPARASCRGSPPHAYDGREALAICNPSGPRGPGRRSADDARTLAPRAPTWRGRSSTGAPRATGSSTSAPRTSTAPAPTS